MEGAGEAEVVLRLNSTTRLIFYQGGASAQGGVGLRQYGGGNNPSRRNPGRKQHGTPHGRSSCRKSPSANHLPLLPLMHQVDFSLHLILEQSQSLGGQQHVQGPADGGLGGDPS